jgi:hypothetical protein
MSVRAPHLYRSLRCFCLGAFSLLSAEVEAGAEIPFEFEEHGAVGRPALYEYRPLVRPWVEARADRLARLEDARIALEELRRQPAVSIFARAHAGPIPDEDQAIFRTVTLPLLADTAEACGGFDWDDAAFDRAYLELEKSLLGKARAYAAVAPLVGLSAGVQVDLGGGLRVRVAADGELSSHWPEAARLLPPGFGREPDRLCVIELERELPAAAEEAPDAPGELADAVTAIRLATSGAIAAGPVLFERLDWRPYGIRPMLPIAATTPVGEPTRLDSFRGQLAADLLGRLALADDDPDLGEALDRWELSLFQSEPFRSEQLRESLAALLGGGDGLWAGALRAAILLGESGRDRAELLEQLRGLTQGERAGPAATDALRRALVEALAHGDRPRLVEALDESLLGIRPRPAGYFAARALAS